jgi:hypothetical protein
MKRFSREGAEPARKEVARILVMQGSSIAEHSALAPQSSAGFNTD